MKLILKITGKSELITFAIDLAAYLFMESAKPKMIVLIPPDQQRLTFGGYNYNKCDIQINGTLQIPTGKTVTCCIQANFETGETIALVFDPADLHHAATSK